MAHVQCRIEDPAKFTWDVSFCFDRSNLCRNLFPNSYHELLVYLLVPEIWVCTYVQNCSKQKIMVHDWNASSNLGLIHLCFHFIDLFNCWQLWQKISTQRNQCLLRILKIKIDILILEWHLFMLEILKVIQSKSFYNQIYVLLYIFYIFYIYFIFF